jgi:tRNA nucleotidyltransferase/poly(A) polymerase
MSQNSTHSIILTSQEEELFNLLLQVLQHFGRKTVLRVAGGWVRDKLLGKESHDIDIALDDQSGIDFANLVNEFLSSKGLETRTVAVIQVITNPKPTPHQIAYKAYNELL